MARSPEVDLLSVGAGELIDEDKGSAVLAAALQADRAVAVVEVCVKINKHM